MGKGWKEDLDHHCCGQGQNSWVRRYGLGNELSASLVPPQTICVEGAGLLQKIRANRTLGLNFYSIAPHAASQAA